MAHHRDARKRDAKIRQIQTLYQSFEQLYSIIEVEREAQYELSIPLGPSRLAVRLYLPDGFPEVPPQLYTVEKCSHPCVVFTESHQCQIKELESLRRWDSLTPLGKILKEVETEMAKRPPILFEEPGRLLASFASIDRDADSHLLSSANWLESQPEPPHSSSTTSKITHIPFEMPDLARLGACDLEELLNDESKFFEFFQELDFIKKHKNVQAELEHACEVIASENLSLQGEVQSAKSALSALDQRLASLAHEYDEHYAMQESFFHSHGHEVMLAKMKALIAELEKQSERIVEAFKGQREEDVESFIADYRRARRLYHLRSEKLEKLKRDPRLILL